MPERHHVLFAIEITLLIFVHTAGEDATNADKLGTLKIGVHL
jgi:hypothetical protein